MKTRTTATASSFPIKRFTGRTRASNPRALGPSIHDIKFSNTTINARLRDLQDHRDAYRIWANNEAIRLQNVATASFAELETAHEKMSGGGMSEEDIQASFNERADEVQSAYLSAFNRHKAIVFTRLRALEASIDFYVSFRAVDDQTFH